MKELVRLYGLGLLKPVVSRVYPLDDAARALEDMGARKVVGKVVIETRSNAATATDGVLQGNETHRSSSDARGLESRKSCSSRRSRL